MLRIYRVRGDRRYRQLTANEMSDGHDVFTQRWLARFDGNWRWDNRAGFGRSEIPPVCTQSVSVLRIPES